jgi:hypothetical protein
MKPLYAAIVQSQGKVADLVSDWHSRLQVDGPGSVANALSLAVDAARPLSSRPPLVTTDMIVQNLPSSSVKEISSSLAKEAAEKRTYARARKSYRLFWSALVQDSPDSVLFDTDLLETLIAWLAAMSSAPARSLRLTACDAAYAIVDGLIEVGNRLRSNLATYQRQLSTEQKNASSSQSGRPNSRSTRRRPVEPKAGSSPSAKALSTRGKDLAGKVSHLSACNKELGELTDNIFTAICLVKYRDVSADVRVASVQALGKWVMSYPDHFLDDTHNKYIGWLLFDKDASVRKAALGVLIPMLAEPKFAPSLEMFLRRFVTRIVEMSNDKDVEVSVLAVRLCSVLVTFDVLDEKGVDHLCSLYASDTMELRHVAGEFIAAVIKLSGDEAGASETMKGTSKRSKTTDAYGAPVLRAKEDLRELIFTVLSERSDKATTAVLVVDSVWDHLPSLRCWKAYSELFSEYTNSADKGAAPEEQLGGDDMVSLAGVLLGAGKHISRSSKELDDKTGRSSGRQRSKIAKSVRDSFSADHQEFTSFLGPLLPKLMIQFRTDERVLVLLSQLPRYFDLSVYTLQRMEPHFNALLGELGDMLRRQSGSPNVLKVASGTLKALAAADDPLANTAEVALGKEGSNASNCLRAVVRAGLTKSAGSTVAAALAPAAILSELTELPDSASQDALSILRAFCHCDDLVSQSSSIAVGACRLMAGCWMWATHRVFSNVKSGSSNDGVDSRAFLTDYAAQRERFVSHLLALIEPTQEDIQVCSAALKVICLILTLSSGLQASLVDGPWVQSMEFALPASSKRLIGQAMTRCVVHMIAGLRQDDANSFADCRDLLSCIGQTLFLNLLPNEFGHLPLLGFAAPPGDSHVQHTDEVVSVCDMAKLFHERICATMSHADLKAVEARALLDAIEIDKLLQCDEDHPSLRTMILAIRQKNTTSDLEAILGKLKQTKGPTYAVSESKMRVCLELWANLPDKQPVVQKRRAQRPQGQTKLRITKRPRKPIDMTNVRRSGRTRRVSKSYAEVEWDVDDDSDIESGSDIENASATSDEGADNPTEEDGAANLTEEDVADNPSEKDVADNTIEADAPHVQRSKRARRW